MNDYLIPMTFLFVLVIYLLGTVNKDFQCLGSIHVTHVSEMGTDYPLRFKHFRVSYSFTFVDVNLLSPEFKLLVEII